jgi:ribosomal protein S18 acetylase RimI-like enzyme
MNPQVEKPTTLSEQDLDELCEATEEAIIDGNGFGWLKPPPSRVLQSYWKGVLLVPQRELFIARLDGHIVGAAQLLKPPPNNEAQSHSATLTTFFIAPDARGHGLARGLLQAVEDSARAQGFELLDLDVRETQTAAISLYEGAGFTRWAIKQRYAKVKGAYVAGWFYSKNLTATEETAVAEVVLSETP